MRKILIIVLSFIFIGGMALAGDEGKGGQPGNFRDLNLGGRPSAMGGAYTAVAEGGIGHLYNPGGGAQSRKNNVSFSYRFLKLDRKLGFASFTMPAYGNASLSFCWIYAGTSDLEPRNEMGYVIDGEIIDYSENFIGINFAKMILPQLHAGGKVIYIQQDIANIKAYTAAVDLGILSKFNISNTFIGNYFRVFHAGLTVENIGAIYRWITTDYWQTRGRDQGVTSEERFPLNFRLGLAASNPNLYLLAADFEINSASEFRTHFGGEYSISRELALRAGLDDMHPTFGAGFFKHLKDFAVGIDAAYLTDKAGEGDDMLISLDIIF